MVRHNLPRDFDVTLKLKYGKFWFSFLQNEDGKANFFLSFAHCALYE